MSESNYFCHNCGTINIDGTRCTQCQSEFLEEIPARTQQQPANDDDEDETDDQQVPLVHEFENLFNNGFDIQSFTNMLLPMLMSQVQSNPSQQRRRRGRPPRRIKRIAHRYLPPQANNTPASPIQLLNIMEIVPGQVFNTQLQSNIPLVQVPFQLFIFDQDPLTPEMLTQLLNEDNGVLPVTRDDINRLPTLTMTPSNLLLNSSCAICLENFDSSSEVKQLPTCHHVFHTNCLTEWLLRHGNCPMCRTVISASIQRTSFPLFNDQWMRQLFFRTFGQRQQQNMALVPYPPVKTTNLPQISSTSSRPAEHSSSDTHQLPRFDSQTHSDAE